MDDNPIFELEPTPFKGLLERLDDEGWQKGKKTVMRLHRNLGHPTED